MYNHRHIINVYAVDRFSTIAAILPIHVVLLVSA